MATPYEAGAGRLGCAARNGTDDAAPNGRSESAARNAAVKRRRVGGSDRVILADRCDPSPEGAAQGRVRRMQVVAEHGWLGNRSDFSHRPSSAAGDGLHVSV